VLHGGNLGLEAGPPGPKAKALLLLAFCAARLPYLLVGPGVQLSLLPDDASYYLEAARRSVETGAWPTLDGRNPTHGFHPLYMLVQIALQRLVGTEPSIVVPCTLALHLVLNAVAVALVLRALWSSPAPGTAARTSSASAGALFTFLLLALDPAWTAHGLSGLDAGLSSLLLLVLACRWYDPFTDPEAERKGTAWMLDGVLGAAAVLARTDSLLFLLLGFQLLVLQRIRAPRRRLAGPFVTALVAFALVLPWLVVCYLRFGSIAQDSGVAIAYRMRQISGPPGSLAWLEATGRNLAFWIYRLGWTWGFIPLTFWLVGLRLPWNHWRRDRWRRPSQVAVIVLCLLTFVERRNDLWYIGSLPGAGIEIALGALGLLAGLLVRRVAPVGAGLWSWFAGGYVVLVIVAYVFGLGAFQVWYSTGPALLLLALTAPPLLAYGHRHPRFLALVLMLVVAQCGWRTFRYLTHGAFEGMRHDLFAAGTELRERLNHLDAPQLVADRTPRAALRFGSFDSGELSYLLHPFPVTNLDGVMNHAAAQAMRAGAFDTYLQEDGITHILQERERIEYFQRVAPFTVQADPTLSRALRRGVFRILAPDPSRPRGRPRRGSWRRRAGDAGRPTHRARRPRRRQRAPVP